MADEEQPERPQSDKVYNLLCKSVVHDFKQTIEYDHICRSYRQNKHGTVFITCTVVHFTDTRVPLQYGTDLTLFAFMVTQYFH